MVITNIFKLFLFFPVMISADIFYIIDMVHHPKTGMFASANQVLAQLYLYEHRWKRGGTSRAGERVVGLTVDFAQNGLYYDPQHGANWWSYYFEPIEVGTKEYARVKPISRAESVRAYLERYNIPREEASNIITKYVQIKPHILEKVDRFVQDHFSPFFVIGVHYRGTDKHIEAPRVAYEEVFNQIEKQVYAQHDCKIFVATDEIPFLEAIKCKFPNQVIYIDAHRASGDQGIHFTAQCPYELGEEALIDCLLLSKTDILIRTSSSLSLWSTYFNPSLQVILLNQRYRKTNEPE